MTSQLVLTDGHWIQFFTYQLNTLHLWKPNSANPLRNLLWVGPRMQLYDTNQHGVIQGVNQEAVQMILQMLHVVPMEMSIEQRRPFAAERRELSDVHKYIANYDEEQLPQFKPGQYEYPKNAVYY